MALSARACATIKMISNLSWRYTSTSRSTLLQPASYVDAVTKTLMNGYHVPDCLACEMTKALTKLPMNVVLPVPGGPMTTATLRVDVVAKHDARKMDRHSLC